MNHNTDYGDEKLTCILCGRQLHETIKHRDLGLHPDLVIIHLFECPAYQRVRAERKLD